ncbi:MAG: radical SAM protein [Oscillospiraceae bacterium]|nr:radical SAM protein [Oscillospiraceae bacterium]
MNVSKKHTNISIFIPHAGCRHKCSFCDQKTISGSAKAPDAAEVFELLKTQAPHLEERGMSAEIAFFGGSFTAIERGYMESLLTAAARAMSKFTVYTGIRCSTRPDCIDEKIAGVLKDYGVTAVELGAQSMSDEVLKANERGHTAEDVRRAANIIRAHGIELGLQMMTGLYCDTPEKCLYTANEFIKLRPRTVRIYPTVILKNTRLGELFERGEYKSFSFDETVALCAKLLRKFTEKGVCVIRMGLHASPDVERDMLGGVYHPALREIVESRIFLEDLTAQLVRFPKGKYLVYTDPKNLSKAIGQKKSNINALAELGYEIEFKPRVGVYIWII